MTEEEAIELAKQVILERGVTGVTCVGATLYHLVTRPEGRFIITTNKKEGIREYPASRTGLSNEEMDEILPNNEWVCSFRHKEERPPIGKDGDVEYIECVSYYGLIVYINNDTGEYHVI
ncbi:MAG: hypothetical protein KDA65_02445 [Planctomycetaceae bacterium]|nr:hypothetical protein [Planctomycetaceae bacterium]